MELLCYANHIDITVLILIVMEDTHGVMKDLRLNKRYGVVLILIVMEDTHGAARCFFKTIHVTLKS